MTATVALLTQDSLNRVAAVEYESNMVNLIQDIRRDLQSPRLAICIAVAGIGGWQEKNSNRELVINAQFNAADPRRHPELGTNVRVEETRAYWREPHVSPPPWQPHHWGRNAESMWKIGSAMADGLLEALTGKPRGLSNLVAGRRLAARTASMLLASPRISRGPAGKQKEDTRQPWQLQSRFNRSRILSSSPVKFPLPIVDIFFGSHEVEMLRYRLRVHSPFVYKFIVVESRFTFTGIPKRLHLREAFSAEAERFNIRES